MADVDVPLNLYPHIRAYLAEFSGNIDDYDEMGRYEKCCRYKREEAAYTVDNTNTGKRIKQ
jgi:hypothetical protein